MTTAALLSLLSIGYDQSQSPAIILSDINLMVTTDMHSWVSGRPHEPQLNASIADMVTLVDNVRALARKQMQDVFLFDNGGEW